jgi:hypothetical protein
VRREDIPALAKTRAMLHNIQTGQDQQEHLALSMWVENNGGVLQVAFAWGNVDINALMFEIKFLMCTVIKLCI